MAFILKRAFLTVLVLGIISPPLAFAQDAPSFLYSFGGSGEDPGQLGLPRSLSIRGDEIFVLEYGNFRVSVFDLSGSYIRHWGERGMGKGFLRNPRQLTVTPDGFVYVTDAFDHHVQKFSMDGVFQLAWGSLGTGDSQFNQPDGIAHDADGDIWVVDRLNNALKEFDADGNFLSKVTSTDLVGATDVVPLPDGTLYATIWNTLYTGLRHFDAAANVVDQTTTVFQTPRGLFQAPNGDLYVSAAAPVHRVSVVDSASLELIVDWGGFGAADDQFDGPYDVVVSSTGRVYVADSGHDLVKAFGSSVPTQKGSWGRLKGGFGDPQRQ